MVQYRLVPHPISRKNLKLQYARQTKGAVCEYIQAHGTICDSRSTYVRPTKGVRICIVTSPVPYPVPVSIYRQHKDQTISLESRL